MGFWLSRDRLAINVGAALASESETARGSTVVFPVKVVIGIASENSFVPGVTSILGSDVVNIGDPPRLNNYDNFIANYGPAHASSTDASNDYENYDGDRVHRFLADRTGDPATYMPASASVRDAYWQYSSVNNLGPSGHLKYPLGLYYWVLDNGYSGGSNANYSSVADAFAGWTDRSNFTHRNKDQKPTHYNQAFSRDVAYALLTIVFGERLVGAAQFDSMLGYSGSYPLDYRLGLLLGKAEHHLRQWRTDTFNDPQYGTGDEWYFMTPFMVAITCYCLAQYYDIRGNDNWGTQSWTGTPYWPDIPTAIEDVLSWMYNQAPNHTLGGPLLITDYAGAGTYDCFPYSDINYSAGGGGGSAEGDSPELNMIIAPCYAWLGKHFGNPTYVTDMADRLFAGAAYDLLINGDWWATRTTKQYNQFFVWAQEYFTWRQQV